MARVHCNLGVLGDPGHWLASSEVNAPELPTLWLPYDRG